MITEAQEDREDKDEYYETEDEEFEESQQREEEPRRDKAESAPLRSRDYDIFADVCSRWVREESPLAPSNDHSIQHALLQLNDYDSDSDEGGPLPSPVGDSLCQDQTMEAWTLLDSYLKLDSRTGAEVHDALKKLSVGPEWETMWGRITGMEPDDDITAKAVRDALDLMKPTIVCLPVINSEAIDDPKVKSDVGFPCFDDLPGDEAKELTDEQKDLAQYLNGFLDVVDLEDFGFYYLRCRVSDFFLLSGSISTNPSLTNSDREERSPRYWREFSATFNRKSSLRV